MKLTELTLLGLQTAYMQRDLTTQGFCAGLQDELKNCAIDTYNILMYQALTTVGDTKFGNELVDELAWQFHVDYYDKTADFEVRRKLVKQSILIHKKKGTPQAVLDLLNTAFPSDTILLEWFDYGGEPYHFKVITSSLDDVDKAAFIKALDSVKNERSYLESIEVFSMVMNYAINKIKLNLEIEYKTNVVSVGEFVPYTFQNGETLNINGVEYGFYE